MGISDTTVETGSDKRHHHKRHHSKHHSKHKQGHHGNDSSSDHKPKHKHRHHKHHHHKHHSHKKHRHKTKVALDEAAIQSALEILEADALEAVKDQVHIHVCILQATLIVNAVQELQNQTSVLSTAASEFL